MDHKGQYLAQNDQKRIFQAKFGRFWAEILTFWRGGKSFGTHTSENQLGTWFPLFLVGHNTKMDQKGKYLAKMTDNSNFRQYLAVFGPKLLIFKEGTKTFGTLISENLLDTFG